MIQIRRERAGDEEQVRRINRRAFEGGAEAEVVDRLRRTCEEYLGFVATEDERVVGHILFTPVTVDGSRTVGMGLAPMAVDPDRQRRGVGTQLVRHGLEYLRTSGCPFVVVLGHPEYYPRFGFTPARPHRLTCQWEGVPDEAFMVLVFEGGKLPGAGGTARYRREFDEAM